MKLRTMRTLLITLAVIILSLTTANAENFWTDDYSPYMFQYSQTGIVLCTQLTIRTEPSTSASEYGKLNNGQTCTIIGQYDEWYIIDLSSLDGGYFFSSYNPYGFIKSSLVKLNPYWITLTQYTNLYADPWGSGVKNGEQSGRTMLVISESQDYYCVQCRDFNAGSSFIRKWDVGQYYTDGQVRYLVAEDGVPMYDSPWGDQVSKLSMYTIVTIDAYSDIYCHVTVNGGESGWVKAHYIQQIIN